MKNRVATEYLTEGRNLLGSFFEKKKFTVAEAISFLLLEVSEILAHSEESMETVDKLFENTREGIVELRELIVKIKKKNDDT